MSTYNATSGRRTAASLVNLAGSALAVLLIAHIVFVLFNANFSNGLVSWVAQWSEVVGLWFVNLFDTGNTTFTIILNFGLAAVFWLVVTGIVARVLRSVG
ncbi:hypothetical protein LWC34_26270 [Kibdelosporangium philippinense]|uniref:Uncharacterized protein n=1 Tax=Kibdelosporangium philippinense TaxID=211113 RepID=A0ABS8ZKJ3_9PSEU|nr:hypothetical protein [Kibdelosporangium philippinense]MCE7006312.1 hypothetical protein [Kibdelosporangium philippinense]